MKWIVLAALMSAALFSAWWSVAGPYPAWNHCYPGPTRIDGSCV